MTCNCCVVEELIEKADQLMRLAGHMIGIPLGHEKQKCLPFFSGRGDTPRKRLIEDYISTHTVMVEKYIRSHIEAGTHHELPKEFKEWFETLVGRRLWDHVKAASYGNLGRMRVGAVGEEALREAELLEQKRERALRETIDGLKKDLEVFIQQPTKE